MVKSISLLLPVYVTFMWALVFLLKRNSLVHANKVLGMFMLTATLLYCSHAIFFHQFYHLYSFIDSLYLLTLLSLYPLFYGYILALSTLKLNRKKFIFNFFPAIILSFTSLILTFLLSPDERIMYVKDILIYRNLKDFDLFTIVGMKALVFLIARITFILQVIVYLLLGIRLTNKYNVWINEYFSNTERRRMKWVRDISIVIIIVSIAGIAFSLIGRSYFAHKPVSLLFPAILFSSIYFIIGFKANQQEVLTENLVDVKSEKEAKEPMNGQASILKDKLLDLFENEKVYMQTDLRITTLSEVLQTNRTYLSRLINVEFGMNFNEFVNHYRVREAEKLLHSSEHNSYTLEYIAEEAGFGTSNSFTRAFKEFKGVTPGQFRKNSTQP